MEDMQPKLLRNFYIQREFLSKPDVRRRPTGLHEDAGRAAGAKAARANLPGQGVESRRIPSLLRLIEGILPIGAPEKTIGHHNLAGRIESSALIGRKQYFW